MSFMMTVNMRCDASEIDRHHGPAGGPAWVSVVTDSSGRLCGSSPASEAGCSLSRMSAEPAEVEDPNDPEVILRDLPEQERAEFLRQYHQAVDAAHEPVGYQELNRLPHAWRLTVVATSQAGYYEEVEAVRNGTAQTRPAEEIVPGWPERLAAARARIR